MNEDELKLRFFSSRINVYLDGFYIHDFAGFLKFLQKFRMDYYLKMENVLMKR